MEKNQNFKRNFYTNDDSGKVFLIALLAPVVLSFIFSFICGYISAAQGIENIDEQLWCIIPSLLISQIAFISIFLIYNKTCKISFGAAKLNFKLDWRYALLSAGIAVVAIFGIISFIGLVDVGLEKIGYNLQEGFGLPNNSIGWLFVNILLLAIIPAICEELLFRGVILQGLRRNFKEPLAIFLSALMFALMHGSLQQFIYPLILGIIFGLIFVRGNSVIYSIIAHFVNNFIVVLLDYLQKTTGFDIYLPYSWWWILISVLLLFVTGVILYLVDRFLIQKKFLHLSEDNGKKELVKRPSLFLIISWAVAVVLWLIATILRFI